MTNQRVFMAQRASKFALLTAITIAFFRCFFYFIRDFSFAIEKIPNFFPRKQTKATRYSPSEKPFFPYQSQY